MRSPDRKAGVAMMGSAFARYMLSLLLATAALLLILAVVNKHRVVKKQAVCRVNDCQLVCEE